MPAKEVNNLDYIISLTLHAFTMLASCVIPINNFLQSLILTTCTYYSHKIYRNCCSHALHRERKSLFMLQQMSLSQRNMAKSVLLLYGPWERVLATIMSSPQQNVATILLFVDNHTHPQVWCANQKWVHKECSNSTVANIQHSLSLDLCTNFVNNQVAMHSAYSK